MHKPVTILPHNLCNSYVTKSGHAALGNMKSSHALLRDCGSRILLITWMLVYSIGYLYKGPAAHGTHAVLWTPQWSR